MATIIFESQEAFNARENKEDNGVSSRCLNVVYNGSFEEYEAENLSNKGCWDVVQCTDCTDCVECTNSSHLTDCNYCNNCTNSEELNNCTNCENSSLLDNCDNMESCTKCKDCNFCIDAEGLVAESFVAGAIDEMSKGMGHLSGVVIDSGSSGSDASDAVNAFGNLKDVNIGGQNV